MAGRSGPFHFFHNDDFAALLPRIRLNGYGLGFSPFARHYWGNHSYFLFLQVLRCFSSLRLLTDQRCDGPSARRVVPFGNLRINGHLRLPAAYRSLSRPSSLTRAKASTVRPFLLSRLRQLAAAASCILTAILLLSRSLLFRLFSMSKISTAFFLPTVENNGFEPLTPCLQSRCSSQLS